MNVIKKVTGSTVFKVLDLVHRSVRTPGSTMITVLFSCVLVFQGYAHPHGDKFISVTVPPELPTSATREIIFQGADDWWIEEIDRESVEVSRVEEVIVERGVNRELMEFIASFPQAWAVTLIEPQDDVDLNRVMAPLAKMKNLKYLYLNTVWVNPQDSAFLANLSSLTEFRSDMFLHEKDLYSLGTLPALAILDIIAIIDQSDVEKQPEGQFLNLQELSLGLPRSLHYFESSTKLKKLRLGDPVSEVDVRFISSHFKALEEVSLTVPDLEMIQPLLELNKLKTLNLTIHREDNNESRRTEGVE